MKKIVCFIFIVFIQLNFVYAQDEYYEILRSIELFGSTYKEIVSNYVDDISPKNLMKRGINGMLEGLDPFSNFFDESEKEDIDILTTGKYGGIGIVVSARGDELVIMEVMPGYAAQRQGVRVGDIILEIDGEKVTSDNAEKMTSKVRGKPGTEVKLIIKRPPEGKIIEYHLIREEVKISNISIAGFLPESDGIYYIKIDRFSKRLVDEFLEKVIEAKKQQPIKSFVIDLRSNPGGLLQSAIELLELFIPKGELILYTQGRTPESRQEFYSKTTPQFGELPLVVLIDGNSASASEIVAGTIQDLDRGVIIGEKSFGKGLVQTIIPLPFNASLKLTTARYYTQSGRCLQKLNYLKDKVKLLKYKQDSTKIYFTKNKRKVLGDGGVTPDTTIFHNGTAEIVKELLNKGMFFKFVADYLSDQKNVDFNNFNKEKVLTEFTRFLKKNNFSYQPASIKTIDNLIDYLKKNNINGEILSDLQNVKNKLKFNLEEEMKANKDQIFSFLLSEIATQSGNIDFRLQVIKINDKDVRSAISVLLNQTVYKKFLGIK